jgi:hypothetical protein
MTATAAAIGGGRGGGSSDVVLLQAASARRRPVETWRRIMSFSRLLVAGSAEASGSARAASQRAALAEG